MLLRFIVPKFSFQGLICLVSIIYMGQCVSVWLYAICVWVPMETRRGVRSFRARDTGSCESSSTGAGNGVWVLYKSRKQSFPQSHLSRPIWSLLRKRPQNDHSLWLSLSLDNDSRLHPTADRKPNLWKQDSLETWAWSWNYIYTWPSNFCYLLLPPSNTLEQKVKVP